VFDRCTSSSFVSHRHNEKMKGNNEMTVNITNLKAQVEAIVADGEEVVTIAQEFETLPGISKVAKYINDASSVLKDVQEFLNEA
jgi:hypothetical protein